MYSTHPARSHRRSWERRALRELSPLWLLAAACTLGDDPREQPAIVETTPDAEEAKESAPPASPLDDATPPTRNAGANKAPASDPRPAADAGAASSVGAATGLPVPDSGATSPLGSLPGLGNLPGAPITTLPTTLDAGVSLPDLSTLTPDAAVSLTCASEFATCVLANVLESGPCLANYGDCEPGFRGGDAGIDGTCAVHFSACVLENPLAFDRCFPKLTACSPPP